jgi:hypothetical protein
MNCEKQVSDLGSIGDDKAADSIEDTAVELSDLPNYIAEFSAMMERHGQSAIYYAHAGVEKFATSFKFEN